MALNVKKGDNVLVIAGKDKGKTGKVLVAMPADNSVVVAGVNMIAKHKKPRSANDKGGIIKKEGKIDASNVQIICPNCGKATRVASAMDGDKKIRQCKKCKANLDVAVKKETKKTTTTKSTTKTTTKTAPKAEVKEAVKEVKAPAKTTKTAEKKTTTSAKSTEKKATSTAKTTAKSTSTKTTSTAKKSTTKKVEEK